MRTCKGCLTRHLHCHNNCKVYEEVKARAEVASTNRHDEGLSKNAAYTPRKAKYYHDKLFDKGIKD